MKFKLLGYEFGILGKTQLNKIKSDTEFLAKLDESIGFGNYSDKRPMMDELRAVGDQDVLIPYYPLNMRTLYDIVAYSDVMQNIKIALRKEIFRHGYLIEEKFANKCTQCGKEFENPKDQCDECGNAQLRQPDINQRKRLKIFTDKINDNGQNILDVSKEINDDEEIIDDGYLVLLKDYMFGPDGDIEGSVPVEAVRGYPIHMRIIADKTGRPGRNSEGKRLFVCAEHRNKVHIEKERCTQCKKEMLSARFRSDLPDGTYHFYAEGEVYHKSKYSPSLTYGFPNLLSVWLKVTTLMSQDYYINKYYTKQRPPRGILFVRTPNMDSLTKAWGWMLDQFKKNPHMIPPIAIEGNEMRGSKFAEFIDFMKSPAEMQFVEMRNEFRRQVGATYGVMPLFQADLSQTGGLNNEGLQITVTNRAVEDGQALFNEGFYPWLLEQLEITDYTLELEPSEEKDEMADAALFQQKANNARIMQSMGFDVTLNEDNEFEYGPTETPVESPQQQQMGGLGGMPPGTPPKPKQPFPSPPDTSSLPKEDMGRMSGQPQKVMRSDGDKFIPGESVMYGPDMEDGYQKAEIIRETEEGSVQIRLQNGEVTETDKDNVNRPEDIQFGNLSKEDAPVTTQSVGVFEPTHSPNRKRRRRKRFGDLLDKTLRLAIVENKSDMDVSKAVPDIKDMALSLERSVYGKKFEGMTKIASDKIKEYMISAMVKGYDIARIQRYVKKVSSLPINQVERIVRTEMQSIQNTAREWSFKQLDPKEKFKYKWLNPMDARTSGICKNIVKRTSGGVTLDQLRKVIEEEAQKVGQNPREWTPHQNCRSTFVRVMD